jgi:cation transport ATPase
MSHIALDISGMTCAACCSRVAKSLARVEAVKEAAVNLALERATIELTEDVTPAKLIEAVEKAGYGATLRTSDEARRRVDDAERDAARLAEERQTLLLFAGSALLSLPLVIGTLPMLKTLSSRQGGAVAFVGDGVNDGPALATARLGIALSSGTDVAREAAHVTLMRPDLRLVPAALDIAVRTRRTISQNLGWAFVYNLIGIPLAATGSLSPTLAGAAMAFSSVSVVANSVLLARWKPT